MTRDLVYGRNAVREALRGPREVLEVWASERAVSALDWLADGPRPRVHKERELTEAAGTPDHQGVVAWCAPYPYADAWELAAVERPLICCLDQVTDPRNLGAVVRSAAGAGATGVVVPAHGATVVTPVVCRASAGAVEHLPGRRRPEPRPLPRRRQGRPAVGVCRRRRRRAQLWDVDLTDGVALVFGAEGKGVRPLVRRTCDATISIPLAPGVESLNVSVAAAVALFEAAAAPRASPQPRLEVECAGPVALPVRRLEPLPRRRLPRPRRARRPARELRRRPRARAASSSSTASATDRTVGPLEVRFAPDADTALERLAAERRGPRGRPAGHL